MCVYRSNGKKIQIKIYALIDPRTCVVNYVGSTQNELAKRLYNHIAATKTALRNGLRLVDVQIWISELLSIGINPIVFLLEKSNEYDAEKSWMEFFKKQGHPIKNIALISSYQNHDKLVKLVRRAA